MGNSSSTIHTEITTNILNESITNIVNDNTITASATITTDQTAVKLGDVEGDLNFTGKVTQDAKLKVDIDATITKLSKLDMAAELSAKVAAKLDTMNKNQEPIIPGSSTDTNTTNIIKNNITNIIKQNVKNIDSTTCSANARALQTSIEAGDIGNDANIGGEINQSIEIEAIAKCVVSDTAITKMVNEMVTKTKSDLKIENENKNVGSSILDSFFGGITGIFGVLAMPLLIGFCVLLIIGLLWWVLGGKDTVHKGMEMQAQQAPGGQVAQIAQMVGKGGVVFLDSIKWWR